MRELKIGTSWVRGVVGEALTPELIVNFACAVPALAGLPARAALRRLEELDLGADLAGSGRVVSQSPSAGKVVERGTRVRMTLAPAG